MGLRSEDLLLTKAYWITSDSVKIKVHAARKTRWRRVHPFRYQFCQEVAFHNEHMIYFTNQIMMLNARHAAEKTFDRMRLKNMKTIVMHNPKS